MKKLIIVCITVILSGLSCKKICACDPAQAYLFLVVKNSAGQDIFNPSTQGYYTKDQILLYGEGLNGQINPVRFDLNPPMPSRLSEYQIRVSTIAAYNPIIYLKLGNQSPYTLNITISKDGRRIDQLLVDGKNVPAHKKPDLMSLFYFSQK